MNSFFQNPPEYFEEQVLADLLASPDLWRRIKVLEPEDFSTYKHRLAYEILLDIHKREGKISRPLFIGKWNEQDNSEFSIMDYSDSPIHPTDTFFDDFISVIRNTRINHETILITEAYSKGQIDNAQLKQKLKDLEGKKLGNYEVKSIKKNMADYYERFAERYEMRQQGKELGILTGFQGFDDHVRLTRGELITVAARTGIGKSAFTMNLGLRCAERGANVLFVSVEMSQDQILERTLAYESEIDSINFKLALFDNSKLGLLADKINDKYDTFKFIHTPRITSEGACKLAREQEQVDVLIVDYLQILKDPLNRGETNTMRIAKMTSNLKQIAGELDCVVIAISQVNRESAKNPDKLPKLENLRDSGAIEQDSDKVLILNRDKENDPKNVTLHIIKNRTGQESFALNYKFDPSISKFTKSN
jgi:replicative DNA helicase